MRSLDETLQAIKQSFCHLTHRVLGFTPICVVTCLTQLLCIPLYINVASSVFKSEHASQLLQIRDLDHNSMSIAELNNYQRERAMALEQGTFNLMPHLRIACCRFDHDQVTIGSCYDFQY